MLHLANPAENGGLYHRSKLQHLLFSHDAALGCRPRIERNFEDTDLFHEI